MPSGVDVKLILSIIGGLDITGIRFVEPVV
jgi:hypothetical protein